MWGIAPIAPRVIFTAPAPRSRGATIAWVTAGVALVATIAILAVSIDWGGSDDSVDLASNATSSTYPTYTSPTFTLPPRSAPRGPSPTYLTPTTASSPIPTPTAWRAYSAPDGSFSASVPALPSFSSAPINTAGMHLTMKQYLFYTGNDSITEIGAATYPVSAVDVQRGLEGALRGMANSGLTITHQAPSTVAGLASIEFTGSASGHTARGQVTFKGSTLFTLISAESPRDGAVPRATYERILASFVPS